jgi:hypothetical protein
MGVRAIRGAVVSDRIVHRAERVPGWVATSLTPAWRALCGVPVGRASANNEFEFEVAVALEPEAWRLAANCSACQAATELRDLSALT